MEVSSLPGGSLLLGMDFAASVLLFMCGMTKASISGTSDDVAKIQITSRVGRSPSR